MNLSDLEIKALEYIDVCLHPRADEMWPPHYPGQEAICQYLNMMPSETDAMIWSLAKKGFLKEHVAKIMMEDRPTGRENKK